MKRFHVNLAVADLEQSTRFYTTLFGAEPTLHKDDYAKWMLNDPSINFSIALSGKEKGINHIGLQVDTTEELADIRERLDAARSETFDQSDAECCYANSTKTWVRDPDDVAWETFVTHGEITHYGNDGAPDISAGKSRCCGTETDERCCA